jgi:hypothetical protein
MASDDGGRKWAQVATVSPMQTGEIFRCKSGVYIMGVDHALDVSSNITIVRMLDDDGTKCVLIDVE